MKIDYSKYSMRFKPGASESMIQELLTCAGRSLPEEYLDFLRFSNGAVGTFAIIYEIGTSIRYNKSDIVKEDVRGFFVIGSDGADEAYGYNLNLPIPEIVMIPFIGGSWKHAVSFGISFPKFLEKALKPDISSE